MQYIWTTLEGRNERNEWQQQHRSRCSSIMSVTVGYLFIWTDALIESSIRNGHELHYLQILRGYFLHIIYAHDAAVSFYNSVTKWRLLL